MRSAFLRRSVALSTLLLCCASASFAANDWYAGIGVTGADVGLDESRPGLSVGVGRVWSLPGLPLDLGFAGEYVQKAGNQSRLFYPSDGTPAVGDEEIRLHYLQPAVSLGYTWARLPVAPRLYLGAAMALKLSESWTRPVEDGQEVLFYDDYDLSLQFGVTFSLARVGLDLRWSHGVINQLNEIETEFPSEKSVDPLPGVDAAEDGAKISHWSAGVFYRF